MTRKVKRPRGVARRHAVAVESVVMRHLVLSDLHANLEAFTSVLADARREGFDRVVCLGDLVGYGASPNEVVDLVRSLEPAAVVRGNHDKVACGLTEGESFHEAARLAALWTRTALAPGNTAYLRGLPEGPLDAGGFMIAHGSPADEEDYILGELDAARAFEEGEFDLAFFGHTHFPCVIGMSADALSLRALPPGGRPVLLSETERYLVNPGSIGQPRDQNPQAAYVIYDDARRAVLARRVDYDLEGAGRRILAAGLPEVLAQRLHLGV